MIGKGDAVEGKEAGMARLEELALLLRLLEESVGEVGEGGAVPSRRRPDDLLRVDDCLVEDADRGLGSAGISNGLGKVSTFVMLFRDRIKTELGVRACCG